MRFSRCDYFLVICLCLSLPTFLWAEQRRSLPEKDMVEVPAIGEGLCVSNLFQTNMVLQRDKPIRVWGWATGRDGCCHLRRSASHR
ncbi:MAG: hypothetical protein ACUVQG_02445 [Thermogutta sp.]